MTTPPGSCKHPGQPFGPNNPPRLRKPGESVEEYRIAMGWDKPAWPHCSSAASVDEAVRAWIATWPEVSDAERLKMTSAFRAGVAFAEAHAAGVSASDHQTFSQKPPMEDSNA